MPVTGSAFPTAANVCFASEQSKSSRLDGSGRFEISGDHNRSRAQQRTSSQKNVATNNDRISCGTMNFQGEFILVFGYWCD